jgi:hypothetical protein
MHATPTSTTYSSSVEWPNGLANANDPRASMLKMDNRGMCYAAALNKLVIIKTGGASSPEIATTDSLFLQEPEKVDEDDEGGTTVDCWQPWPCSRFTAGTASADGGPHMLLDQRRPTVCRLPNPHRRERVPAEGIVPWSSATLPQRR